MKQEKLETILARYPWLEPELSGCIAGQGPDHHKFEFISIKAVDAACYFGSAKEESGHKRREDKPDVYEHITWTVLFQLGDEKLPRGRSVAHRGDSDYEKEKTVADVITVLNAWYQEYWAKQEVPMIYLAVVKKIFRQVGALVLPARVTVFLLNANLEVVGWHYYVPAIFSEGNPVVCHICTNPIEHDIALTVRDRKTGDRHKVHAFCLFPKDKSHK